MNLEINQKLFTRDGRKVGNAYVVAVGENEVNVRCDDGCKTTIAISNIDKLFFLDTRVNVKIYSEIIDIANEPAMTLPLLREILYTKNVENE